MKGTKPNKKVPKIGFKTQRRAVSFLVDGFSVTFSSVLENNKDFLSNFNPFPRYPPNKPKGNWNTKKQNIKEIMVPKGRAVEARLTKEKKFKNKTTDNTVIGKKPVNKSESETIFFRGYALLI